MADAIIVKILPFPCVYVNHTIPDPLWCTLLLFLILMNLKVGQLY